MTLSDLQSATRSPHPASDAGTVDKDAVRPGTAEDKPGDTPLTVAEWAEQMAPYFHEASQIAPDFGGGQDRDEEA